MTCVRWYDIMPHVRLEFFGVPRERAGVASLPVETTDATLGAALRAAAERLPEFARRCLDGDRLKPGLVANINGRSFSSDPGTPLTDGDSVLILSADVGG